MCGLTRHLSTYWRLAGALSHWRDDEPFSIDLHGFSAPTAACAVRCTLGHALRRALRHALLHALRRALRHALRHALLHALSRRCATLCVTRLAISCQPT